MNYVELDSNSEKILKLFLTNKILSMSQVSVLLQKDIFDFNGYIKILLGNGYIKNSDTLKSNDGLVYCDGTYHITTIGAVYFDLKKRNEIRLRNERLWRFVPIAISLLALIKSYEHELTSLLQWLRQSP